MFGSSKPIPFEPYGRRRSRRGIPRWLILMLLGAGLGVGGVLFVQERYLPPRLGAEASAQLRASFEQADAERQRLQAELGATSGRLSGALDENKRLAAEVSARGETLQRLRQDIVSLVASLPPDPRKTPVSVRAANFEVQGNTLAYNVVLSRVRAGANPFGGVMQLVVAGVKVAQVTLMTRRPISLPPTLSSTWIVVWRGLKPSGKGRLPRTVS